MGWESVVKLLMFWVVPIVIAQPQKPTRMQFYTNIADTRINSFIGERGIISRIFYILIFFFRFFYKNSSKVSFMYFFFLKFLQKYLLKFFHKIWSIIVMEEVLWWSNFKAGWHCSVMNLLLWVVRKYSSNLVAAKTKLYIKKLYSNIYVCLSISLFFVFVCAKIIVF